MPDFFPFLAFVFALALVAILGHGMWVLVATILRALFGNASAGTKTSEITCHQCGSKTSRATPLCDRCGLPWEDVSLNEVTRLAAVFRQLKRLLADGNLPQEQIKALMASVEERYRGLRAAPNPVSSGARSPGTGSAAAELAWLAQRHTGLTVAERNRAAGLYDQLSPAERSKLPAATVFDIGNILLAAERGADALKCWFELLRAIPGHPGAGRTALHGAKVAMRLERWDEARRFLLIAQNSNLPPVLRREWEGQLAVLNAMTGSPPPESPPPKTAPLEVAIPTPMTVLPALETRAPTISAPDHEDLWSNLPADLVPIVADVSPVLAQVVPSAPNPAREASSSPVLERSPVAPVAPPRPVSPSAPVAPPRPSRRTLNEVLSAFMEDRNIRWGELVGGLLIVVSSIALLISLWPRLRELENARFLVVVGVSAGLFGIGLYTEYRLKLRASSRGVLSIAMLLVPLEFIVLAGGGGRDWRLVSSLIFGASLLLITYLVYQAGKVLVGAWRWPLTISVMVSAALVRWVPENPTPLGYLEIAAIVSVIHTASLGYMIAVVERRKKSALAHAPRLLTAMGLAAFSLAAVFGLLIARAEEPRTAARELTPFILLTATSIAAAGLSLARDRRVSVRRAGWRVASTTVGYVAMVTMLASLALALPYPPLSLMVGVGCVASLGWMGWRWRQPIAHAASIAAGAIVYSLVVQLATGELDWSMSEDSIRPIARLLWKPELGAWWIGLFGLLAIVSEFLARSSRKADATIYKIGAIVAGTWSLTLVTLDGFAEANALGIDPSRFASLRAFLAFAIIGAYGLAINLRHRLAAVTYLSLTLLTFGGLWSLDWFYGGSWHWAQVGLLVSLEAFAFALVGQWIRAHPRLREESSATGVDASAATISAWLPYFRPAPIEKAFAFPLAAAAFVLVILGACSTRFVSDGQDSNATWAFGVSAIVYFLLAWSLRKPWISVLASGWLYAAFWKACHHEWQSGISQPFLAATLAHATTVIGADLALGLLRAAWIARRSKTGSESDAIPPTKSAMGLLATASKYLSIPASQTGIGTSILAFPLAFASRFSTPATLAGYLFWLGLLWLALAFARRSAGWFASFQGALVLSSGFYVWAWLIDRGRFFHAPVDVKVLMFFQAAAVTWGGMCLLWTLARIRGRDNALAKTFLQPSWPAVDRLLFHSLVGVNFVILAWAAWHGAAGEFDGARSDLGGFWLLAPLSRFAPLAEQAGALWAWIPLATLVANLVLCLRGRFGNAELASSLFVAVSAVFLIARRFQDDLAVASATRWGLALMYAMLVAAFAYREKIRAVLAGWGARIEISPLGFVTSSVFALILTLGPLGYLSAVGAYGVTFGVAFAGPQGLFSRVAFEFSYLVPLVLVTITTSWLAARERSGVIAFAGGWIAQFTAAIGYFLIGNPGREWFGLVEGIRLTQILSSVSSLWLIGWLAIRPRIHRADDDAATSAIVRWDRVHPRRLLRIQLGLGSLANLALVLASCLFIAIEFGAYSQAGFEFGSPLGWTAFVLACAAGAFHRTSDLAATKSSDKWGWSPRTLRPEIVGLVGLGAIALVAASLSKISTNEANWSFRALEVGWSSYALMIVVAIWRVTSNRGPQNAASGSLLGPQGSLTRMAAIFVPLASFASVVLALKSAIFGGDDLLWSAMTIGTASLAMATLAAWRRQPGWAFVAGLGCNLTVVMLVIELSNELTTPGFAAPILVQANLLASGVVAVVWLAAERQLWTLGNQPREVSKLLRFQIITVALGALFAVAVSCLSISIWPDGLTIWAQIQGRLVGALAWILASAAAVGLAWTSGKRFLTEVVFASLAGSAVIVASAASTRLPQTVWLSYHVMLGGWTLLEFATLGACWYATRRRSSSTDATTPDKAGAPTAVSVPTLGHFGMILAAAILALGWRGTWDDPRRPWPNAIAAAGVLLSMAGLSLVSKKESPRHISLAAASSVGSMLWLHHASPLVWSSAWLEFFHVNAFCLAALALGWLVYDASRKSRVSDDRAIDLPPAGHWGAILAGAIVFTTTLFELWFWWRESFFEPVSITHSAWSWLALAVTTATLVALLADARARFRGWALYGITWCAAAWGLLEVAGDNFHPLALAALLWATLTCLAVTFAWGLARWKSRAESGTQLERVSPLGWTWFQEAQAISIVCTLALGLIEEFTRPSFGQHSMTAGATALVSLAALGMAVVFRSHERNASYWRLATLSLGAISGAQVLLLAFGVSEETQWLHRWAAVAGSASLAVPLGGIWLASRTSIARSWARTGKTLTPAMIAIALLGLSVTLSLESNWVDPFTPTVGANHPMAFGAIATVALSILALAGSAIVFALNPGLDPARFSERAKRAYVYAAEALVVLLSLHFRMATPRLFERGITERFWPLIVMAISFGGAALGELFHRRGREVLADPLARTALLSPLFPLIGHWFLPPSEISYNSVLFLTALLYGTLAYSRRSLALAALAIVTANLGVWASWHDLDVDFLEHPQLWLIPVGLSLLWAEHNQRESLGKARANAVRYFALALIYVSSAADIYIARLDREWSLWLVLALMGLSLLGILGGILLRVRSFVYLGLVFLLIDGGAMVYHAAADLGQTWVLWTSGIVAGVGILSLFAFFEKHRESLAPALERIKQWD